MKRITSQDADVLLNHGLAGLDCEWGAIIGNHNWIILVDDDGYFLFHRSEYQFSSDGCFCRPYHPENGSLPDFEDVFTVREFEP